MLEKLAISSFRWNLAGSITGFGASFLINIVLARILGPEPFGLVALAMIFISIGNLIIDSGLNSGLIQKNEINQNDIQYIFTIQILMGLVIGGLIICLAPWIAKLYHQPAVIPVLQTLTIGLFFQAAGQTSTALLKRKLEFKRIQQAQIFSMLVGYLAIGLPLAYTGYGIWSLVFSQLTQSILYFGIVYASEQHPLHLNFRDDGGISHFGISILGANIANWIIYNYDNTSVGWAYGTTNLGLYNRAWSLAMTPVGIVVKSCQSVLFSATSKLQESSERIKDVFIGIFVLFGITIFPFSLFESLVSHDLILFVYGEKWLASTSILMVLALAMPFYSLTALQGPVLAGLGKPHIEFKIQWFVVGFILIIFMFAIKSSFQMIVWSVLLIYIFRFLVLSLPTFKILKISKHNINSIIISIISFSVTVTLSVYTIKQVTLDLPIFLRLLFQGATGLFVWIFLFLIGWNHFLPTQVHDLVNRFFPKKIVSFLANITKVKTPSA